MLTDQLCALLFVTSPEAIGHLAREGRAGDAVHLVGNPMIDTLLASMDRFDSGRGPDRARAAGQVRGRDLAPAVQRGRPGGRGRPGAGAARGGGRSSMWSSRCTPGAAPRWRRPALGTHPRLHIAPPLGYLEFVALVRGARAVITDSGGVQEETTLLRVPCLTLRPNTERPVTVTNGSNRLVTRHELASAVLKALRRRAVRGRAATAVGRPGRPADRPGHHRVAGPGGPSVSEQQEPGDPGLAAERDRLARTLRDTRLQLAMTQARLAALEQSATMELGRTLVRAARRPWSRGVQLPADLVRLWRERGGLTGPGAATLALASAQLGDLAGGGERFLSALTAPGLGAPGAAAPGWTRRVWSSPGC